MAGRQYNIQRILSGYKRIYPDKNTVMEKDTRICEQCGAAVKGRLGKRFCGDQCRASFNNLKKQESSGDQIMKHVNAVLRRNRTLLKQASPQGKTTLRREVLVQAGFNFQYFTNIYRTQKGSNYYFCYDFGYLFLAEDKVLIVNRQPYMAG